MEDVSKALLIAAGMLLAILILSALVVFYNQISTFYAQESEQKIIEQTQKFNAQFENYNGQEIRGNELISIMNRIIDYNNLQADMEGYERININIDMQIDMQELAKQLAFDDNLTILDNFITNRN